MSIDPASDWWDVATAVGTIGAAVFAGGAALVAARATKSSDRSAKASELIVALEAERRAEERQAAGTANVGASLRKTQPGGGAPTISMTAFMSQRHWLRIWNNGPAKARDLHLECDRPDYILDPTEVPPELPAFQPADVVVRGVYGGEATPLITVIWTDGNGPQRFEVPKVFLIES